jgi:hypothetical protein
LHDVSHYLAGVIHGDPYVFLDEFSKARAAWGIFLHVYKDIIRLLVRGLSLEVDPHDATRTCANPETDFRVLGIKVFKDTVFAEYQSNM